MARTVKVGLDVEEGPFVRGMGRAERAAEGLDDALDDVSGSAKETAASTERAKESTEDLGGSARDAGQDLNRLRADAQKLDRQIDETSRSIRDLAREIARTSDEAARADLNKKLNVEQGKLRERVTLRKLVDVDSATDMGAELAAEVSASFGTSFVKSVGRNSPMLARALTVAMNPAVAAIGAPIAAGVVTLIGTAVGGAIIGGVGVGGVVGGLALAAKDPAVKAAGTALGADLSAMLGRSSSAFVPVTLDAIDTIRARTIGMEREFNNAFTSASKLVDPLVDGLFDAAQNAMPGLISAIDAAGPVIEVVAEGARDLGEAIGEGLSDLAPYADEGARALQTLFGVMVWGVEASFNLVESMARLYKVAEIVGAVLSGNVPKAIALIAAQDGTKTSSMDLTGVLGPLQDRLRGVGTEAITAEQATKELKTAFDELFNPELAYDRALIAYKDGFKELNKELKEGKRTLDTNTQAGRDNATAVLDQVEKIKELRDAQIEQGVPMDEVNAKYQTGIGKIRAKLTEMGYEKSEIDALIGKYEKIPEQVATKVDADTIQAERELAQVRDLIAQIKSKKVVITTQHNEIVTRSEGRNVPIGSGVGGRRWGGIVEHAQWGVLREAQIAAPAGPARYAWAEPATGGEAFIPRFGKRDRSLDILAKAARWYGQQMVPASAGGARDGGGSVNHYYWQPQQAVASMADFDAFQRRQDALARVGRPR